MAFPDEKVLIKEIIAYNPAGIDILSIYPAGEEHDISENKSGYLYLIPELDSPALEAYDNASKLPAGKFTLTSSALPDIGEVYVDPTTGAFAFNEFESVETVWFFYNGYGTLVDADTYYNRVREVVHDLQDHLLTASGQRLQEIEASISGLQAELISVSGALQSNINSVLGYASGVNSSMIAASSYLAGEITDLSDHVDNVSGYLAGFISSSYLNSINYTNVEVSGLRDELIDSSSYLQGQITAFGSVSGNLQSQITANAAGISGLNDELAAASSYLLGYTAAGISGLNAALVTESGRIDTNASNLSSHIGNTSNPHGVTYSQIGAAPLSHDHDDRYYTESEIDTLLSNYALESYVDAAGSGLQSQITDNYNYLNTASGLLDTKIDTVSGVLSAEIDTDVFALSGILQPQINANASGLLAHEQDTGNPHEVTLEQARSQGNTVSGDINMGGWKVTALGAPSTADDAVTKGYVDSLAISAGVAWQEPVLDILSAPPISPDEGDRYIIDVSATGAWSGEDNKIAQWQGSDWVLVTPSEGWRVWLEDEDKTMHFNGTTWVTLSSTIDHGNLIGLNDDDHPQYYNAARLATWDDDIWGAIVAASGRIDTNASGIMSVSGQLSNYLPLVGGTMGGSVDLDGFDIIMGNGNISGADSIEAASITVDGNEVWHGGNDTNIMFDHTNKQINSKFHFASGVWFDTDYNTGWISDGDGAIAYHANGIKIATINEHSLTPATDLLIGVSGSPISGVWTQELMLLADAPSASGSAGNNHEIRVDDEFIYFKGANGWLKIQGTLMPA